VPQDQELEVEL
jgi:hypothetical protein